MRRGWTAHSIINGHDGSRAQCGGRAEPRTDLWPFARRSSFSHSFRCRILCNTAFQADSLFIAAPSRSSAACQRGERAGRNRRERETRARLRGAAREVAFDGVCSISHRCIVEQAKAALADCASLVAPASSPPRIRISGLGSFRQQVVFAQLQPSDDLDRVAALVRGAHQIFDARGLSPPAHDSWTPHLTLLKISRVGKPRKGKPTPKLPAAAYEDLPASSLDFGEHELGSLELCSMQGLGADGYYPVLASVSLDGRS